MNFGHDYQPMIDNLDHIAQAEDPTRYNSEVKFPLTHIVAILKDIARLTQVTMTISKEIEILENNRRTINN